jgi:hypothetical protein
MTHQLMLAYIRRKRFEARIIAAEIGQMLFPKKEKKQASFAQLAAWGIGVRHGDNPS